MKKNMRIALVEDNRFHAVLFKQAIHEKHPDVGIAAFPSGKSFLHGFEENRFDLVVLDYNLPDIDGLQLLSIIRSRDPDIPLIMITGVGSEQTAVEAMKSGATDYITKSGDYGSAIPRVLEQAFRKQQLILKNRRLEAKARTIEKLEAITTTASTLNHEINNPLMAILGNIELLVTDERISDPGVRRKLEEIEASARRIRDITHQLTNLINPVVRQTPAGPLLRLKRGAEDVPDPTTMPVEAPYNKSD
jgi:DNA-binding response OmpR family regulator